MIKKLQQYLISRGSHLIGVQLSVKPTLTSFLLLIQTSINGIWHVRKRWHTFILSLMHTHSFSFSLSLSFFLNENVIICNFLFVSVLDINIFLPKFFFQISPATFILPKISPAIFSHTKIGWLVYSGESGDPNLGTD